jgi:hypothetical protein
LMYNKSLMIKEICEYFEWFLFAMKKKKWSYLSKTILIYFFLINFIVIFIIVSMYSNIGILSLFFKLYK